MIIRIRMIYIFMDRYSEFFIIVERLTCVTTGYSYQTERSIAHVENITRCFTGILINQN